MIDTIDLEAVFMFCLFTDHEPMNNRIEVEGVMDVYGFHPERLESTRTKVGEWLSQLPDSFHADKGGGMSFLNACVTKDDEHWGEHPSMDRLFVLGMGLGLVTCLMPRKMWGALPGGMPYYQIKLDN